MRAQITSRLHLALVVCCAVLTTSMSISSAASISLDAATFAIKSGRVAAAPPAVTPRPTSRDVWQTIDTEGFEGATTPGWTFNGTPTWGKTAYKANTGTSSVWCAASGSGAVAASTGYPNNCYSAMVYGPFSLQDATAAKLSFMVNYDTEANYDYFRCWASGDGHNWYGGNSNGWIQQTLDLANVTTTTGAQNYCGQAQVWVALLFTSDGSNPKTFGGAFVDDILLQKSVAPKTHAVTPATMPATGAHGAISPNTAQTVTDGGSVTFTATPDTGYQVSGWYLDGGSNPVQLNGNSYTLDTVTADHTVSVGFTIQKFNIIPVFGTGGTISPSTIQAVSYGGSLTLSATPATGYQVDSWYLDSATIPTQVGGATYTLTNITANHSVKVTFKPATFTITPVAGTGGTINPSTASILPFNGSITYTATPTGSNAVDGWYLDGATTPAQVGGATYKLTNITANHTVKVTFKATAFKVTPVAGANGSISPNTVQTVAAGGSLTFTATPNTGYQVDSWSLGSVVAQSGGTVYKFTPTVDGTLTVTFVKTIAVRTLPAVCLAGQAFTVSIAVTPGATASAYAVEDIPPTGWVAGAISDSGQFDTVNGKVKWGPFFENTARTLHYTLTPPSTATGTKTFGGVMSVDGQNTSIGGMTTTTIVTALPVYQPDLSVANSTDTTYLGIGIFNTTGVGQTKAQTIAAGTAAKYAVQLRNSGNSADVFTLTCQAAGTGWTIQVIDYTSGNDITTAVTGVGNPTTRLAVNGVQTYVIYVTPARTLPIGASYSLLFTAVSSGDGNKKDTVKLSASAGPSYQPDLTVRNPSDSYLGGGVFNLDGTGQTCTQTVSPGAPSCFFFRVQNAGNTTDGYTLTAPAATSGWTVTYFEMTTTQNLTTLFTSTAGVATGALAPGASKGYFVQVTPAATVLTGAAFTLRVTVVSTTNKTAKDVIKTVTTDGGGVCIKVR